MEIQLSSTYNWKKCHYSGLSGIYILLHRETGAKYVGATSNVANRAHSHAEALKGKIDAPWLRKFCRLYPDSAYTGSWQMLLMEEAVKIGDWDLKECWWYHLLKPELNTHHPPHASQLQLWGQQFDCTLQVHNQRRRQTTEMLNKQCRYAS